MSVLSSQALIWRMWHALMSMHKITNKIEILGYDARLPRGHLEKLWSIKRREDYLMSPKYDYALSVDFLVWPSIFNNAIGCNLSCEHKKELSQGEKRLPTWVGPNYPFWENKKALEDYLSANAVACEIILVKRIIGDAVFDIPPEILKEESWELEGFDVADVGYTSVVSDFSSPVLKIETKRQWHAKLNQSHLFKNIIDAHAYAQFADKIFPEHKPFYVYFLYALKQMGN